MKSYSIKSYLIFFVLAVSVPISVLLGFAMYGSYKMLLDESLKDAERFTQLISVRIQQNMDDSKNFLEGLSKRPRIRKIDGLDCDPILSDLKQFFGQYANIAVLNEKGNMVCSALIPASGKMPSFAGVKWFDDAKRANGFHVGELHKGPVSGKWVTVISSAIHDEKGNFAGLIGYSLDLEKYSPLPPGLSMPQGTNIDIVDSKNIIVANLAGKSGGVGTPYPDIRSLEMASANPQNAVVSGHGNNSRVLVINEINHARWKIVTSLSGDIISRHMRRYSLIWGCAVTVALMAGVFLALYIGRRIANPIRNIAEVSANIAMGDMTVRAKAEGPYEIMQVAGQFNRMLDIRIKTEKRYASFLNNASDGIIIVSKGTRIILNNPQAEKIFGYGNGELTGKDISLLVPDDSRRVHESHVRKYCSDWQNMDINTLETRGLRKNGEIIHCELTLNAFNEDGDLLVLVVVRDVSEKKKAEEERSKLEMQLLQAQKVESIGRLAGGVAHDLNNMLSPVLGYAEMLLSEMPEDHPFRYSILQIEEGGERCRDLVAQLLAFARKQTLEMKPVDLNSIITSFRQMLRRTLRENISIDTRLAMNLPLVRADKAQIEQIILNIAINAQDAMPEGGRLIIETSDADQVTMVSRLGIAPAPGNYVLLSVKDTGTGMDDETKSNIFEPFFTTKSLGHGTGLGLSTVHGIVKQHGGHIRVESELGSGTVFLIYLKAVDEASSVDDKIAEAEILKDSGGAETILVLEDQPNVRTMVAESLRRYGYNVLEAVDGNSAIEFASSYKGHIHLLLTDVILTDIDGKTVFSRIVETRRDLRAIFMSGYTADVIGIHGILDSGISFIQKPFALAELARKIRAELDK